MSEGNDEPAEHFVTPHSAARISRYHPGNGAAGQVQGPGARRLMDLPPGHYTNIRRPSSLAVSHGQHGGTAGAHHLPPSSAAGPSPSFLAATTTALEAAAERQRRDSSWSLEDQQHKRHGIVAAAAAAAVAAATAEPWLPAALPTLTAMPIQHAARNDTPRRPTAA